MTPRFTNMSTRLSVYMGMHLMLLCAALLGAPNVLAKDHKMNLPSFEMSGDSPRIADDEVGLRTGFAGKAQRAAFAAGQPWPFFGSYRADAAMLAEWGNRIDAELVLVVTHKESKGIYTGRLLKEDPPPRNVADRPDVGGRVTSMGGYFSVDLKTQLRIPAKPGKYWVVVLLGRVASPPLEFEVR